MISYLGKLRKDEVIDDSIFFFIRYYPVVLLLAFSMAFLRFINLVVLSVQWSSFEFAMTAE